jgi:mannuronan 5-epimerase
MAIQGSHAASYRPGVARRIMRRRPSGARWWVLVCLTFPLALGAASAVDIQWALSSNRIYVNGPGDATLSDIKAAQDQAPVEQVAPGVWHLRASLIIQGGAQLVLHGKAIGGDVNELRLQSNNTTDTNRFVFISADWGSINIQETSITSWDDAVGGPDTEYATNGRAYINVRSELAADGVTPLQSRMDVIHSDIGYLGYDESEAYGLSWKVNGDQPDLFNRADVFGDILDSRIHHNFFGIYTFGAYSMHCSDNEIDHNVQYGFDGHDDSDYLLIQGNNAHHNGNHGIIASKRCDHLTIRDNVCWANAQNGIILHRNSNNGLIEGNQCHDNRDSGVVLTGDSGCTVRSNLLFGNYEAGIRLDLGAADNLIEGNVCASNNWHGFYLYKGSDVPEPNDDGRPKRNRFVNNQVYGNGKEAINLFDSDDNTFSGNTFYANGAKMHFERGFRNRLVGNSIPPEVTVLTLGSPADAPATYISDQPATRVQMDGYSSTVFEDSKGQIFDPEEDGVATSVTTNGSSLVLTAAEIGTTSTVYARNFWADAKGGTVWIDPISWTSPDGANKHWTAKADPPGTSVSYTVGDLATNQAYAVLKEDVPLMTVKPDSAGSINFVDVIDNTNSVDYSIEPGFRVSAQMASNRVAVSWTGGILQHATSLSPPNWQDVPTTNGQFRIKLKISEPMEFFRIDPVFSLDPQKAPGRNFDLSHWKLTLPDAAGSEISSVQLAAGFTNSEFFYTGPDGAIVFYCPVTGGTTGGSDYPRSELREVLDPNSNLVNWAAFGTHTLNARCKVTQVPSSGKTIIGQIHSFTGNAQPLIKLQFDNGTVEALVKNSPNATNETDLTLARVGLSNAIAYQIKLENGLLSLSVNGSNQTVNVFQTDPSWSNQTFYFKAGNYCQDHSGPTNEGAVVSFYQLNVAHESQ